MRSASTRSSSGSTQVLSACRCPHSNPPRSLYCLEAHRLTGSAMDLLLISHTLLGFLFFLFLCRWWLVRSAGGTKDGDDKLPPEPVGAWPVVGHLPLLGGTEPAARTLGRIADLYGPVFILRLGVHRTLVISSQEAVKECFTTFDRDFASRPSSASGKYLGYDHAVIGAAPYGPHWREMRKIATVELLTAARLEKLRHIRTAEVDARMRELHELCTKRDRPMVEMKQWLGDTTFNVIVRMVVGRRYFGGPDTGQTADGGGRMRRFRTALEELMYLLGVFVPSDAVPWLEWLDLQGYIKAMKRTSKELDAVLEAWIEEHREKRRRSESSSSKAEGGQGQDFMDLMLSALEGVHLPGAVDPNAAIKATVRALVAAGTETSAVTMTWALALLLNHRPVLDRVREELGLTIGMARNVEEADVKNLPYLQAVLKETMRLYPAAPLSLPHEAIADCRVSGYHISAGTRLLPNLWKLHRDPRVWTEPLQFRPERFLSPEGAELDYRGQHFEFIPFGSGRRMCPGITFALQMMHLTLARLLHGFELGTPDDAAVDMSEGLGLVLTKATPLGVLLSPRLPPHLYYS